MRSVGNKSPLRFHRRLYRTQGSPGEEVSTPNRRHDADCEHGEKNDSQLRQRGLFRLRASPDLHERITAP